MLKSHFSEYKQISEKVSNESTKFISLHTNDIQKLFAKMKNLRGIVVDQSKEIIFLKKQLSWQSRREDKFHNQQKPSISETTSSSNHSVYSNAVHHNFGFGANQPVKEENITWKPFKLGKLPTFDSKALLYTFMTLFEHSTKGATDDEKFGFLMNTIDTTFCDLDNVRNHEWRSLHLRECIKGALQNLWPQKKDCNVENSFLNHKNWKEQKHCQIWCKIP